MRFKKSYLTFSVLTVLASITHAESDSSNQSSTLPTIIVQATKQESGYVATTANAVLRSDAPLFETPKSISVSHFIV